MYRSILATLVLVVAVIPAAMADGQSLWLEAERLEQAGQHEAALQLADSAFTVSTSTFTERRLDSFVEWGVPLDTARTFLSHDILLLTNGLTEDVFNADWLAWRGFLYAVVGEYGLAIRDFGQALEMNDSLQLKLSRYGDEFYCPVQLYLALAIWQTGDRQTAARTFDEACTMYPGQGLLEFYRDQLRYASGERLQALESRRKGSSFSSDSTDAKMAELLDMDSLLEETLSKETFLLACFPTYPPLNRKWGYLWLIHPSR